MNKQRKVLITITYNEMGIIIDTKAEEVAQPNLQPTCNQLATDCISRQDAINIVDFECGEWRGLAKTIIKEIEHMPSAQPEPKEGHWIDKGWDGDWAWQIDGRGNCWRVIECSKCGKSASVESNFCPHCGADMRGEQK